MARIVDKLSPVQLQRLIRSRSSFRAVAEVRIAAAMGGEEEPVVDAPLGEVLDDLDTWTCEHVEVIREHAEGQGRGAWRYAVRIVRVEDGRILGQTWCRVVVRVSDDEQDVGLDGSVSSYVQQLQRALEASQKAQIESTRLLQQTLEAQTKGMTAMWDRARTIEDERNAIARAALEDEAERARNAGAGDDILKDLIKTFGPVLGDKLADKLAPMLEPMVKGFLEAETVDAGETPAAE